MMNVPGYLVLASMIALMMTAPTVLASHSTGGPGHWTGCADDWSNMGETWVTEQDPSSPPEDEGCGYVINQGYHMIQGFLPDMAGP